MFQCRRPEIGLRNRGMGIRSAATVKAEFGLHAGQPPAPVTSSASDPAVPPQETASQASVIQARKRMAELHTVVNLDRTSRWLAQDGASAEQLEQDAMGALEILLRGFAPLREGDVAEGAPR